jgi:hypothetical protein
MSSEQDQFLASKRQTWHGFGRLLLWGTIASGIATLIAVLFAI